MTTPTSPDPGWMGDPKRGAATGRINKTPPNGAAFADTLRLYRVKISRQGYDVGGVYWGVGQPLYYYANEKGTVDGYVRAADRDAAKASVLALYPNVTFTR